VRAYVAEACPPTYLLPSVAVVVVIVVVDIVVCVVVPCSQSLEMKGRTQQFALSNDTEVDVDYDNEIAHGMLWVTYEEPPPS
jgi:hypothetical protein